MKTTMTLAGLVAFSVAALGILPTAAQEGTTRAVEQYACKEIMRDSGTGRDIAIAFLHGYLLGKSGSSEFDIEELNQQSDAFMDHCIENPNDVAVEVLMTVQE